MPVSLNAGAYDFAQIDGSVESGTVNIVPALQQAVDIVGNRTQGGTVVIGTAARADYPWQGTVVVPPNVSVVGVGDPVIKPVDDTGITTMFEQTDGVSTRIGGFQVDTDGSAYEWNIVKLVRGQHQVVSDIHLFDSGGFNYNNTTGATVLEADDAKNLTVRDVRCIHFWRIALFNGVQQAIVENFAGDSWLRSPILMNYGVQPCKDITIRNGHLRFPSSAEPQAFHVIETVPDQTLRHENLKVLNVEIFGNPNTYAGSIATPGDPGAIGDVIAMKAVDRFEVAHNVIRNGGEIGITAVWGSRYGQIHHNHVERTDICAIGIGASGQGQPRANNVTVSDNTCLSYGLDKPAEFQTGLGLRNRSGIIFEHADDCAVFDNRLDGGNTGTYGVYLSGTAEPSDTTGVAYGSNWMDRHTEDDFFMAVGADGTNRNAADAALVAGAANGRWV